MYVVRREEQKLDESKRSIPFCQVSHPQHGRQRHPSIPLIYPHVQMCTVYRAPTSIFSEVLRFFLLLPWGRSPRSPDNMDIEAAAANGPGKFRAAGRARLESINVAFALDSMCFARDPTRPSVCQTQPLLSIVQIRKRHGPLRISRHPNLGARQKGCGHLDNLMFTHPRRVRGALLYYVRIHVVHA